MLSFLIIGLVLVTNSKASLQVSDASLLRNYYAPDHRSCGTSAYDVPLEFRTVIVGLSLRGLVRLLCRQACIVRKVKLVQ
jgi:hypothetical protein